MNPLLPLPMFANVGFFEILIVFIVIGLPILCVTGLIMLLVLRKGNRSSDTLNRSETKLIQELHQGLNRLESRIEALETILIETERDKEKIP